MIQFIDSKKETELDLKEMKKDMFGFSSSLVEGKTNVVVDIKCVPIELAVDNRDFKPGDELPKITGEGVSMEDISIDDILLCKYKHDYFGSLIYLLIKKDVVQNTPYFDEHFEICGED